MDEKVELSYSLELTGSMFFDAVLEIRAKELIKDMPEMKVEKKNYHLIISGYADGENAAYLEQELGSRKTKIKNSSKDE